MAINPTRRQVLQGVAAIAGSAVFAPAVHANQVPIRPTRAVAVEKASAVSRHFSSTAPSERARISAFKPATVFHGAGSISFSPDSSTERARFSAASARDRSRSSSVLHQVLFAYSALLFRPEGRIDLRPLGVQRGQRRSAATRASSALPRSGSVSRRASRAAFSRSPASLKDALKFNLHRNLFRFESPGIDRTLSGDFLPE